MYFHPLRMYLHDSALPLHGQFGWLLAGHDTAGVLRQPLILRTVEAIVMNLHPVRIYLYHGAIPRLPRGAHDSDLAAHRKPVLRGLHDLDLGTDGQPFRWGLHRYLLPWGKHGPWICLLCRLPHCSWIAHHHAIDEEGQRR